MSSLTETAPRVRNAVATRHDMLCAARRQFARKSYESVGVREIASAAGVDAALVCRYFGSKEELFAEVLKGEEQSGLFDNVTAGGMSAHLAGLILDAGKDAADDAEKLERLLIIIHSASSPKASAIGREAVAEGVISPVAACIGGDDALLRASLALAVLMGLAILRNVMGMDAMGGTNDEATQARIQMLFDAALDDAKRDSELKR